MSYQFTHCPATLSSPGVLRRCTLPLGHTGEHIDQGGPWDLRLLPCTAMRVIGDVTPVGLSCRLSVGHAGLHVDAKTGVSWRDDQATYRRERTQGAQTPKPMPPTAPGWDRVDALALVQHVADLERNLRTQTAAVDALTERVEKLEAALARPAAPSCIAYYPKQHTPRWWWQR